MTFSPRGHGLWVLGALLGVGVIALSGCKPKESAYKATENVSTYARGVSDAAGRATTKAAERLGLVDKKWDYVRFAWGPGEKPVTVTPSYSFEDEREVGRALAAEFIARFGRFEHDRVERYLNELAAAVAAYSDRPDLPVAVVIVHSEERRAWGLPGGYGVVTMGALRCCESESEAAGLLASMFAQASLKHTLSVLTQQAALTLPEAKEKPITALAAEDFARAIQAAANELIKEAPSADFQRAEDRSAVDILVRLGYEPGGLRAWLARVQAKMQEESGGKPMKEYAVFKARESAMDDRFAEIHATTTGRTVNARWRRECIVQLPAPKL